MRTDPGAVTRLGSLLLTCSALWVGGCTGNEQTFFSRIEGVVKEQTTSAPVPGAHVLVTWEAQFGTHAISWACTWIETAETDAQGKFSITVQPSKMIGYNRTAMIDVKGGQPRFRIYKTGMTPGSAKNGNDERIESSNNAADVSKSMKQFFRSSAPAEVTTMMTGTLQPSTLDSHDRLRQLWAYSEPEEDCTKQGDPAQVKRYFNAIAAEAKAIAASTYEKALADAIAARASSSLGPRGKYGVMPAMAFDPPGENDSRDERDRTALMRAVEAGDADKVNALLDAGANPNRTTFHGNGLGIASAYSALTLAIERHSYARSNPPFARRFMRVIEILLARETTNPNHRNSPHSYTPLMAAVALSQDEVVALLLLHGADPKIQVGEDSALTIAVQRSHVANSEPEQLSAAAKTYELILNATRNGRN